MISINKIKNIFHNYSLKQGLKKQYRQKKPRGFNQIKTVGIIYAVPQETDFYVITDFVKFFQDNNKVVKALGFINSESVPHYCFPKLTYDYYTKKDLNWYGKPSSNFVNDFINNDFDLMIDLSTTPHFSISYIAYMSVAAFKLGSLNDNNLKHYDFMLNIPHNIEQAEYIKQIKHYITNININNDKEV